MAFALKRGERFGRLTVDADEPQRRGKTMLWACLCDCGTRVLVSRNNLRSGHSSSCGCGWRDAVTTHGKTKTTEYIVWSKMKRRCLNPNDDRYEDYGGRGITIDPRWVDGFEAFLEDMGPRPEGTQLDRRDNDGPYCKANCRWATRREQQNNTRRNRVVEFNGEKKTMAEWARSLGMPYSLLQTRIQRGWPIDLAFTRRSRCWETLRVPS